MRRRSGVVLLAEAGHGATGARLLLEQRRRRTPQTREVASQIIHSAWDEGEGKTGEARDATHIQTEPEQCINAAEELFTDSDVRMVHSAKMLPAVFLAQFIRLIAPFCLLHSGSCIQTDLFSTNSALAVLHHYASCKEKLNRFQYNKI